MVKSINRKLSPALALPIVPSQILYPPAPHIFIAQQLSCNYEEPAFVRKDFMYKYVHAEMLSGVHYHYCPGVISM